MNRLLLCCLLVAPSLACAQDQIPKLSTKTLSGTAISLPGGDGVKAYILSFGFSHSSDKAVAAWDSRIAPVFANAPGITYYELPVMEGLPGLVTPMVHHGMRRALPKPEHARFAPLYMGDKELRRIVGFSEPKAAYVVVAAGDGKVVWKSSGAASDEQFQALKRAVEELAK